MQSLAKAESGVGRGKELWKLQKKQWLEVWVGEGYRGFIIRWLLCFWLSDVRLWYFLPKWVIWEGGLGGNNEFSVDILKLMCLQVTYEKISDISCIYNYVLRRKGQNQNCITWCPYFEMFDHFQVWERDCSIWDV